MAKKACLVCGREDRAKPQIYRGEDWCSDRHRKVVKAETVPTTAEMNSMDPRLLEELYPKNLEFD